MQKDRMQAASHQQAGRKFGREFGDRDIEALAAASGGIEGVRDILASGVIEGQLRRELEEWLRAQDEMPSALWRRQNAAETALKRATAAEANLKKKRRKLAFAAALLLCALSAVVWQLKSLPLH